jgi:4-carboxymuconolactone decarboxylase
MKTEVPKISAFPTGEENKGFEQYFSGKSWLAPLASSKELNLPIFNVTFEPGSINNWHRHTEGQILIAVGGVGYFQERGKPAVRMVPGDVIEIAPDVEHWHGAAPDSWFSHIAINPKPETNKNTWLEPVSKADYAQATKPGALSPALEANLKRVSPALARYNQEILMDELWKRSDLSPRDRSIVTVTVLIARNQTHPLPHYVNLALDSGVKPAEISEIITHLAFYAGWCNATDAAAIVNDIFEERGIGVNQLPTASPKLLPMDEAAEERRATSVRQNAGSVSPGLEHFTTAPLFHDLWRRPSLAPRDRSLVTVSSLIANGNIEQVPFHLNRAMDNGLTQAEAAEVIAHIAFYAGWPRAFSAVPVAKEVFESRKQ